METTSYILKDNIGSINYILDDEGDVVQEQNFDAWGRRRDPATWQYYEANATLPTPLFERGYTLHEHLDVFKLINMNGRMYDPVLARFLSADPVIQSPENSQSYNSYSYVFNNPLKFTDPSGFVAIGDSTGNGESAFGISVMKEIFNIVSANGSDEGTSSFSTSETSLYRIGILSGCSLFCVEIILQNEDKRVIKSILFLIQKKKEADFYQLPFFYLPKIAIGNKAKIHYAF